MSQLEIHVVEPRSEHFTQRCLVCSRVHELDDQALVLHLADGQSAKAEQPADANDGGRIPRIGLVTGGPHRQRSPLRSKAVVHAGAIDQQLLTRAIGEILGIFVDAQVQADTAEEAVGFQQLIVFRDLLSRASAGNRAREEQLRAAIDGVHVAESVQRIEPGIGRNMGNSVGIALNVKIPFGVFRRRSAHPSSVLAFRWRQG